MGTLVNYLRWRGDISFKNCPLTPMDSVALRQISYFDLNNVYVPGKKQKPGGHAAGRTCSKLTHSPISARPSAMPRITNLRDFAADR